MKKYLRYLWYVLKHIHYVRKACWKLDHGLYWQGLVHDLSKFRPSEFFPYANFFYGPQPRDSTYSNFNLAWFYHQKRNPHHWQYWVMPQDGGGVKLLKIPHKYLLEMLCDWWGANKAQGGDGLVSVWYNANGHKMQMHKDSRATLEDMIGEFEKTMNDYYNPLNTEPFI